MGLLAATSAATGWQACPKGVAAAAARLLISGGIAAAGTAFSVADGDGGFGGNGSGQSVTQQLLLGPPYPEDFDTVVLSRGLDLCPTVSGMAAIASAPREGGFPPLWGQAEEQRLSCCCLSAQLLGLLASRESAAGEEENAAIGGGGDGIRFRSIQSAGDRSAGGAAERSSSFSGAGSVQLAVGLLRATCALLTSVRGGRHGQGDDELMSAAAAGVQRRRMAAAKEAAVACNAALQGLGIGALAEVIEGAGVWAGGVGGSSIVQYFRDIVGLKAAVSHNFTGGSESCVCPSRLMYLPPTASSSLMLLLPRRLCMPSQPCNQHLLQRDGMPPVRPLRPCLCWWPWRRASPLRLCLQRPRSPCLASWPHC